MARRGGKARPPRRPAADRTGRPREGSLSEQGCQHCLLDLRIVWWGERVSPHQPLAFVKDEAHQISAREPCQRNCLAMECPQCAAKHAFADHRHSVSSVRRQALLGGCNPDLPLNRPCIQTNAACHDGPMFGVPARVPQATGTRPIENWASQLCHPVNQERGHLCRHVATLRLGNMTQVFRRDISGANQHTRNFGAPTFSAAQDTAILTLTSVIQHPAASR